jgi:hypothetical protein
MRVFERQDRGEYMSPIRWSGVSRRALRDGFTERRPDRRVTFVSCLYAETHHIPLPGISIGVDTERVRELTRVERFVRFGRRKARQDHNPEQQS